MADDDVEIVGSSEGAVSSSTSSTSSSTTTTTRTTTNSSTNTSSSTGTATSSSASTLNASTTSAAPDDNDPADDDIDSDVELGQLDPGDLLGNGVKEVQKRRKLLAFDAFTGPKTSKVAKQRSRAPALRMLFVCRCLACYRLYC